MEKQTETPAPTAKEQTSSPFPRDEIQKAFNNPMLKGFKKYLDPLLNYFETVETRLQASDKNFALIGQYLTKLEPLVKLSEQAQSMQQQRAQAPAQAPSNDMLGMLGQLAPLLQPLLGGGDIAFSELGKKALESQIAMSTAITNAVISKITGNAVSEVAKAVTV